jgi:phosphoserine phosphatase RsbU/P
VRPIEATGPPLGIFCSGQYSHTKLRLKVGQGLLLYTDGLTEAHDTSHSEYGLPRLTKLMANQKGLSAPALTAACLNDLRSFQSGTEKTDDLSVMAIRRESVSTPDK